MGIVGLGTEYLHQRSRETVVSVVHEAIERGVNYMDFVFTFPEYLDHLGAALKGQRDKVIITGHLGAAEKNWPLPQNAGRERMRRAFPGDALQIACGVHRRSFLAICG